MTKLDADHVNPTLDYKSVTDNYTVLATDPHVIRISAATAKTITLPNSVDVDDDGLLHVWTIHREGVGSVVVKPSSEDFADGIAQIVLTGNERTLKVAGEYHATSEMWQRLNQVEQCAELYCDSTVTNLTSGTMAKLNMTNEGREDNGSVLEVDTTDNWIKAIRPCRVTVSAKSRFTVVAVGGVAGGRLEIQVSGTAPLSERARCTFFDNVWMNGGSIYTPSIPAIELDLTANQVVSLNGALQGASKNISAAYHRLTVTTKI